MALEHEPWTPEVVGQWQRIINGLISESVGAFMLIWQTVFASQPSALLVGAGLLAIGVPPALGIDRRLQARSETG